MNKSVWRGEGGGKDKKKRNATNGFVRLPSLHFTTRTHAWLLCVPSLLSTLLTSTFIRSCRLHRLAVFLPTPYFCSLFVQPTVAFLMTSHTTQFNPKLTGVQKLVNRTKKMRFPRRANQFLQMQDDNGFSDGQFMAPPPSSRTSISSLSWTGQLTNSLVLADNLSLCLSLPLPSSMEVNYLGCHPADPGRCWTDHRVVAQSGHPHQSCMTLRMLSLGLERCLCGSLY